MRGTSLRSLYNFAWKESLCCARWACVQ